MIGLQLLNPCYQELTNDVDTISSSATGKTPSIAALSSINPNLTPQNFQHQPLIIKTETTCITTNYLATHPYIPDIHFVRVGGKMRVSLVQCKIRYLDTYGTIVLDEVVPGIYPAIGFIQRKVDILEHA